MIVHVVIGSEAADLDSVVSAKVYADFLSKKNSDKNSLFVAAANIPKEDLGSRKDILYILKKAGIKTKSLLFSDTVDLRSLYAEKRLRLILVDHCRLIKNMESMAPSIEEIIDHHNDAGTPAPKKKIGYAGSCASLIGEKISENGKLPDKTSALLLSAAVLSDTADLSPDTGRTTEKDIKIIKSAREDFGIDTKKLFKKLMKKKSDIYDLSLCEIFKKDYKGLSREKTLWGFASVPVPLKTLMRRRREDFYEAAEKFRKDKKAEILFIMSQYIKIRFFRELGIIAAEEESAEKIINFLNMKGMQLEEELRLGTGETKLHIFSQGNTFYSRKKVMPLAEEFLSEKRHS